MFLLGYFKAFESTKIIGPQPGNMLYNNQGNIKMYISFGSQIKLHKHTLNNYKFY